MTSLRCVCVGGSLQMEIPYTHKWGVHKWKFPSFLVEAKFHSMCPNLKFKVYITSSAFENTLLRYKILKA